MVFLDSYLMDTYEVSNKDYGEFVTAKGHPAPAYWDDPRLNKPQQPVVGVNWEDAKAFCEYRGKRLPTEAEWEKAARGPEGNLYPWGNDFDPAKVNYGKNHDATMPVDSYPEGASYYGLYHMAGNAFEWVSDWYDPRYYGRLETMVNPTGPDQTRMGRWHRHLCRPLTRSVKSGLFEADRGSHRKRRPGPRIDFGMVR